MPIIPTDKAHKVIKKLGLTGMDLVRICGLSVKIAYKLANGSPVNSFEVFHKLYSGLKEAGYDIEYDDLTPVTK